MSIWSSYQLVVTGAPSHPCKLTGDAKALDKKRKTFLTLKGSLTWDPLMASPTSNIVTSINPIPPFPPCGFGTSLNISLH